MSSKETVKTGNHQAELVIIGGGGAGLSAALAAAEQGCKSVIVLEKAGSTGGSTAMAHDVFGAESPVQRRLGHDARRDDLFQIAMEWAHWSKINPRIVRAFIDKSGDTIRWLEEKGITFDLTQFFLNQVPRVRHTVQGEGAELMKVLRKHCEDTGIKVITRTRARKLIREERGNITGVVAETKDGELTIMTRSVIITSGGYGNNKEILKKYCPPYNNAMSMEYDGVPSNTGDGLLMATEIGAATAGLGSLMIHGPGVHKSAKSASQMMVGATENDAVSLSLSLLIWEPQTIWVNKRGRRFIDEGHNISPFASGNAVAQQPDATCYTLFDSKILQSMEEEGLIRPGAFGGQTQQHPSRRMPMAGDPVPGLEKALRAHIEKESLVKIADTLDEIADWIGCRAEVLKATIDEYNAACDQNHDPVFVKDRRYLLPIRIPPYYVIRGNARICDAIGGIKINENMEVLDSEDNPIPGLFAAGVCTGCWESESYCYRLTGHLVGFALNSGRIAGENAVAYISR